MIVDVPQATTLDEAEVTVLRRRMVAHHRGRRVIERDRAVDVADRHTSRGYCISADVCCGHDGSPAVRDGRSVPSGDSANVSRARRVAVRIDWLATRPPTASGRPPPWG